MTAAAIANLLHARGTGVDRWQARCPAHRDQSPSLSIREGLGGRTLIRCWAGCPLTVILEAAGLKIGDLFAGPPSTAAQAHKTAQERVLRESESLQARRKGSRLATCNRKLNLILDQVAGRLARMPDGAESELLAEQFHSVLEKVRDCEELIEAEERRLFHERVVRLARKSERVPEAS